MFYMCETQILMIHYFLQIKKNKIPKIKTLKLTEITKPLPKDTKEILLLRAIKKLLVANKTSTQNLHEKIVTTLATTFCKHVREHILTFLLTDLRSHVNVALAWLYEEYSIMQVRHTSVYKNFILHFYIAFL